VNIAFDHSAGRDQSPTDTIPNIAKRFKARNQPWALVVDENYGEGSAREHAALQPRFYGRLIALCVVIRGQPLLGCALIVARSFARIHETNLKVRLTCSTPRMSLSPISRNKVFFLSGSQTKRITPSSAPAIRLRQ
jgi:Aconitase C-terminal domain